MKKLAVIVLSLFFVNVCFAAENYELPGVSKKESREIKSPSKLERVGGIVLSVVGLFLAIDGFKKIDISKPSLDTSHWTWTKEKATTWWVDSNGTVTNTGNVALKDVKLYRTYYNASGQMIANDYCYLDVHWLDSLPTSTQDSWDYFNGGWANEPMSVKLTASYGYDKIKKNKNTFEGVTGLACMGAGLYLIVDYNKQLRQFAQKTGIEIKVVNKPGSIFLFAQKSFTLQI